MTASGESNNSLQVFPEYLAVKVIKDPPEKKELVVRMDEMVMMDLTVMKDLWEPKVLLEPREKLAQTVRWELKVRRVCKEKVVLPAPLATWVCKELSVSQVLRGMQVILEWMVKRGHRALKENQEIREKLVKRDPRERSVVQVLTDKTAMMGLMENLVNLEKREVKDLKDQKDLGGFPEKLV